MSQNNKRKYWSFTIGINKSEGWFILDSRWNKVEFTALLKSWSKIVDQEKPPEL